MNFAHSPLIAAAGAAVAVCAAASTALPPYTLLDLGDFIDGNASGGAFGINDRGEPVGAADDPVGRQAFIYTSKGLTRLPTPNLPHAVYSEAFFANNHGVVAGNTYTASLRSRAAYWDHRGYHDLGTLGGAESWVLGLNAAGAIIGLSDAVESFSYFLWLPAPMYGYDAGMNTINGHFPRALNDAGQTASQRPPTPPESFFQPAIWLPEPAYGLPAGVTDLATDIFPNGVVPQAINNRGAIVGGGRSIDGVETPALWLPEPMYGLPAGWHDLGQVTPERDRANFAWDINDRGWIVGTRIWVGDPPNEFEDPPIFTEGWLWIPPSSAGHGRIGLDELLPPAAPGEAYFVFYPRAINNRGQIAASAPSVAHGQYRAVLLSPACPADWNADAVLDSGDFFDFLADFFAAAADYNDDGGTNSADFFDLLTDFFAGC